MRNQGTALEPRDGVLVLSGYGLRASVHHGRLALSDNLNGERRETELSRATCGLRRLVLLGHTGSVTLDALRWLADIGAAYVQIDADGELIACFAPEGVRDVNRRRAQARTSQRPAGVGIVRVLLEAKLRGQADLLRSYGAGAAADSILRLIRELATDSPHELRFVESRAADVHWRRLAATPVLFAQRDLPKIPTHWRTLGSRHSPLSTGPRNAATPANALLNYLNSVVETEIRIALLSQGLDPEMGLLHASRRYRNALAHDVIEPLRPLIDRYVLDLLGRRVFSSREFVEMRTGVCRLVPPLPQALAATARFWDEPARSLARWLAVGLDALADDPAKPVTLPPLPALRPIEARFDLAPRCRTCGRVLAEYRRKECADCAVARRGASMPRLSRSGQAALARLRAAGRDPRQTAAARERRARAVSERHAEARAWKRTRAQIAEDSATFRDQILPRLRKLGVAEIARLTGLSKAQCSLVRRGLRTLHPRHWATALATPAS